MTKGRWVAFGVLCFMPCWPFSLSQSIIVHGSMETAILNLERLENRPFLRKIRENLDREGILCDFYPSQGKVREHKLNSQHVTFINHWRGCLQSRFCLQVREKSGNSQGIVRE